jgi:hypothetical protein
MNPFKNPFRFYGFQKLAHLVLAAPVVLVAALALAGSPPEGWSDWPAGARFAVAKLSGGAFTIAGLWWLTMILRPICRSSVKRRVVAGVVLFFFLGLPGMWAIIGGFVGLTVNGGSHAVQAITVIARVALLPVAIGVAVTKWPDVMAYLRAHPTLRRWTVSGTGRHSSWAGPIAIRRHVTPIEQCRTGHGYFSDGVFVGRTNFEDTFARGEEVFLRGPSHLCTIAQTGGGKHICAAGNYAMHRGSMVHITVKPEAADQFLASRVDQDLLPPYPQGASAGTYGVDPRGITKVTRWLPKSQAFLLDAAQQSVFPSNRHTLLSEIDSNENNARVLALAIADGSFPDDGKTKDPWFREAPRNYLAAGILHALTYSDDRRRQNLPRIIERAMGIDRVGRENGPQVMTKLLNEMVRNPHPNVGSYIKSTAVQITELGDRGYGTLKSEFQTKCSWALDPFMDSQLTGVSDFSYRQVGDDERPTSVFIVPPRGDAALRAALPWLRSHAELSLQILQTNLRRPSVPTLYICDEARQYLQGIQSIRNGLTLLRDARVKLWLMFQSWPSALETLGEDAAAEMEACSTMIYFSINDLKTAQRICERMGFGTHNQRAGVWGEKQQDVAHVITADEVLRELSLTSPLTYVMGGGVMPMRLSRAAYKTIVTGDGTKFAGLPLAGQYDEGLSRYSYGGVRM